MKSVQSQTTKSYYSYLIESLRDPEEAAAYLETFFEEENPEPELLKMVLTQLLDGLGRTRLNPEQIKEHQDKLNDLLSQPTNLGIYQFSLWLNALGLKISIKTQ